MSAACGCTKAVASTTGISPSIEYAATWPPLSSAGARACEECTHPRPKLFRLELRTEDPRLLFDAREHLMAVAANQSPRRGERLGRLLRQRTRQRARLIEKRRLLDHTVDESEPVSGVGIERLTEEQQLGGSLVTDEPRQQQGASGFGHQTEPDEWQRQQRV